MAKSIIGRRVARGTLVSPPEKKSRAFVEASISDCLWRYKATGNAYWAWGAIRMQVELGGKMPDELVQYLYIAASAIVNRGAGNPREMLEYMGLADRRGGKQAAGAAADELNQFAITRDYFDTVAVTSTKAEARRLVAERAGTTPGNVEQVVLKVTRRMKASKVPAYLRGAADAIAKARENIIEH